MLFHLCARLVYVPDGNPAGRGMRMVSLVRCPRLLVARGAASQLATRVPSGSVPVVRCDGATRLAPFSTPALEPSTGALRGRYQLQVRA